MFGTKREYKLSIWNVVTLFKEQKILLKEQREKESRANRREKRWAP